MLTREVKLQLRAGGQGSVTLWTFGSETQESFCVFSNIIPPVWLLKRQLFRRAETTSRNRKQNLGRPGFCPRLFSQNIPADTRVYFKADF